MARINHQLVLGLAVLMVAQVRFVFNISIYTVVIYISMLFFCEWNWYSSSNTLCLSTLKKLKVKVNSWVYFSPIVSMPPMPMCTWQITPGLWTTMSLCTTRSAPRRSLLIMKPDTTGKILLLLLKTKHIY